MAWAGIQLDADRNQTAKGEARISADASPVQIWVVPTNEELVVAAVNLVVFVFGMTGFGDITLTGTPGHRLSVIIMIFGVTLFLRLVQVLLRPAKVRYSCPTCGLQRHDRDAVHCKTCGTILNIPDEGKT